jgi:hypothetical protein
MKIFTPGGLLAKIVLTLVLAAVVALAMSDLADEAALARHDQIFKRALVTFGVVKALNSAISVVQGTQIAAAPAGVGVTLSLGEVLDPLNDLVERFSWVMLASSTALGLQLVLINVGAWWLVKVVLALCAALTAVAWWHSSRRMARLFEGATRLLGLMLLIRFIMPAVNLLNQTIYNQFLSETYQRSTTLLEEINNNATTVTQEMTGDDAKRDETVWQDLKQTYAGIKEALDIKRKLAPLLEKLRDATTYIVNLITVFLLQTILIPLASIWGAIRLWRIIWSWRPSAQLQGRGAP